MGKTGIEWTDVTWNPVRGCSRVSEGCRHCYAETQAARIVRMGKGKPTAYDGLVKLVTRDERQYQLLDGKPTGNFRTVQVAEPRWTGEVRLVPEQLDAPLRWRTPQRVFVNSMSDLFHEKLTNEEIAAVFGVMAAAPQHTFQVLTKRARRMREWFEWAEKHGDGYDLVRVCPSALLTCAWEAVCGDAWADVEPPDRLGSLPSAAVFGTTWPLRNVWLGVSVENQAAADDRIPHLMATTAAVRGISAEPLLGSLDLSAWSSWPEVEHGGPDARHHCSRCGLEREPGRDEEHECPPGFGPSLDWVIAGCESGPGARPADAAWYRSLRDQCEAAGVAFFMKQATEEGTWEGDNEHECTVLAGPGSHRKPGGVIGAPYLDGVQHLAFPEARRD